MTKLWGQRVGAAENWQERYNNPTAQKLLQAKLIDSFKDKSPRVKGEAIVAIDHALTMAFPDPIARHSVTPNSVMELVNALEKQFNCRFTERLVHNGVDTTKITDDPTIQSSADILLASAANIATNGAWNGSSKDFLAPVKQRFFDALEEAFAQSQALLLQTAQENLAALRESGRTS